MRFEVNGLVLRENPVGESDSWLDILTADRGRISAYARAVRKYKSKYRDAAQPMSYSSFVLERKSPDFTVMAEARLTEAFGDIRELAPGALSMYVTELLREFSLPDTPQDALLRLGLNTLHAVSRGLYPLRQIKAAFEVRIMADEGYAPDLSGCADCGSADTDDMYLDIMNGTLVCGPCLEKRAEKQSASDPAPVLAPVSRPTAAAMRYIMTAPLGRMFAFRLNDTCLPELAFAAEQFLLHHLERSFPTLDFYKQVEDM